jgi:hypothetical protein
MRPSERRHTTRFQLRLSCRIVSPFHSFSTLGGITENVSRSGLLVNLAAEGPAEESPKMGNSAHVVLDLPETPSSAPKCLECEATIVRIEDTEEGARRLAFRVRRMQFRDRQEIAATSADVPAAPDLTFPA